MFAADTVVVSFEVLLNCHNSTSKNAINFAQYENAPGRKRGKRTKDGCTHRQRPRARMPRVKMNALFCENHSRNFSVRLGNLLHFEQF